MRAIILASLLFCLPWAGVAGDGAGAAATVASTTLAATAASITADREPPPDARLEQPGRRALTVTEAVAEALARSPAHAAAEARLAAVEREPAVAFGGYLPRIDLRSAYTRVDDQTYETANSALIATRRFLDDLGIRIDIEPFLYRETWRTEFRVEQPLWLGGALRAERRAASARADRGRGEYLDARAGIVFRTKAAYYRLWEAQELLRVAESALAATEVRRDEMASREELGEIDLSVKLRWDVLVSQRELELAAAEGALHNARAELCVALGRPADALVEVLPPEASEDPALGLLDLPRGDFVRAVLSESPVLAASRAAAREAEAGVAAARAGWLPSVVAAGSYGWKPDDDLALDEYAAWSASVAVSYPVFDGLRNVNRSRQAGAARRAAGYAVEAQARELALLATRIHNDVQTARRQLETARTALAQARENYDVVRDRFDLGLVGNAEQVDARAALDAAEAGVVGAEVALRVGAAGMEGLVGR